MKYCLYPTDRERTIKAITAYLNALPVDKTYQVVIGKYSNSRSTQQNAALFGLAYMLLSEHTGIHKDDLHEYYCMKYFGTDCRIIFGRKKYAPIRTTTQDEHGNNNLLSTVDFNKFFEFVQCEAAALGCVIPDPQKDRF